MPEQPSELTAAEVAAEVDSADVDWRATAEALQARVDELEALVNALRDVLAQREKVLYPFCDCTTDPNSDCYGPQQECPIHGDGETFVMWVQDLQANHAAQLVARILDKQLDDEPLMPWPEASQDLALVASRLDTYRRRYIHVLQQNHVELADALKVDPATRSWAEMIRLVQTLVEHSRSAR